jgi:23S rRNA (adenine2503-C2)-methyltransferase
MSVASQFELLGLSLQELTAIAVEKGQPRFRGQQLCEAIYQQRKAELQGISTLSAAFRSKLSHEGYRIGLPEIQKRFQSVDGTVRYLIGLADGESVETVWMPEGDGGEAGDGTEAGDEESRSARNWNRATICISSQVGCAVNCQFCLTAKLGVRRNLTPGEIVGQVLAVLTDQKVEVEQRRINLVFMGMGEPFLNYENFMKAVRLLVEEVGIPESRMTVSTAGIVPRIEEFGREPIRPKLAISLNASNDTGRERVMPINRKWDLKKLLESARAFPLRARERMTFEYVLLSGVNDSPQNAKEVVRLLHGLRAKVNLIALNPGPDLPFGTPSEAAVAVFQQALIEGGIPAFIRRPRGRDIYAACGQLKRTEELITIGTS